MFDLAELSRWDDALRAVEAPRLDDEVQPAPSRPVPSVRMARPAPSPQREEVPA